MAEPTDKERAKKRKEMDLNGDGEISPAERAAYRQRQDMQPDPLSRSELAAKYGYALEVIYANPELRKLFERAMKAEDGQWEPTLFLAKVKDTNWWKNGKYWRQAWVSEKEGSEWGNDFANAEEIVRRRATALGASLDEKQLKRLTRRYLYEGWYDGSRATFLDNALADFIGGDVVDGEDTESVLRRQAWEYGIDKVLGDDYYTKAMRRIARGEVTLEGLTAEMRQQAMSKYKPFASALEKGQTTREAVGSYTAAMSELLEIDATKIDLDDPLLKKAWTTKPGVEGGEELMSVYDFETTVRQDPRWRATGNGRRATMSTAMQFLQGLGFNGANIGGR